MVPTRHCRSLHSAIQASLALGQALADVRQELLRTLEYRILASESRFSEADLTSRGLTMGPSGV
eukprot:scaffold28562_cov30-Tisochrysis_lutea.AAC.1